MLTLRAPVKADPPRFFVLDHICFPAGIAYSLNDFRALLRSSQVFTVVAEEGDLLAGFAMAQTMRLRGIRLAQIITIDVAPEFRRRGLGQSLMEAVEANARSGGAEWLRLEVAVDNTAALGFYARLGFAAIGKIEGYYHGNLDAIAMEKPLAGPEFSRPNSTP